jgi:TRAP-type C4-dicarboxylate transport system permease small subunit
MTDGGSQSTEAGQFSLDGLMEKLTGAIAVFGGALLIGLAMLVFASVAGRYFFSMPVEGDFEFVKMATAIGVFAFLPYAQQRRANIMVDTFTSWMPLGLQRAIDALWDLVFAGFMALCAFSLTKGTLETLKSGETTMMLQIVVWPAIAICALLSAVVALAAINTAVKLIRGRS